MKFKLWKNMNFDEKQNRLWFIFKWMMLIQAMNSLIQIIVYSMFGLI